MIICGICGKEFKNNLGGQLTVHIKKYHNISYEDYYVITELNGIEPKCQCGLCDERPYFYRGNFKKYALGHDKYKWQEKKHIELYGKPKCKNPDCDNTVNFYRGKPRIYCSRACEPSRWNQEKVKKTVKEKYGVENVFQLNEIKEKSKKTLQKKYGVDHSTQSKKIRERIKLNNLKKYGVEYPQMLPEIKQKQKETLLKNYGVSHFSKTKQFRELASKNMCEYNKNIHNNHTVKYYKNTYLHYQSQYEYNFLQYCEKHGLLQNIENSPTFKYNNKSLGNWHLPDFLFDKKYIIEIKSTYWLKRQGGWDRLNAKKKSVEGLGYKYILILDNNMKNFIEVL
jgi:hypothetical protein